MKSSPHNWVGFPMYPKQPAGPFFIPPKKMAQLPSRHFPGLHQILHNELQRSGRMIFGLAWV